MYTPLVLIRKTEKLAFTHLLSDVIIMFVIIMASIFGGIALAGRETNEGLTSLAWHGIGGIGTGISSSAYAFEGIAVVLPVREITADKENFYKLLCGVVSFIAIFYIVFAQWSLWSYGPVAIGENSLVTDAMPPTATLTYVTKIAFCVTLVFTYPLQLSPANNVIESYITSGMEKSKKRQWIKNVSRVVIITLTLSLALSVWT